jgi:hypothetical protein
MNQFAWITLIFAELTGVALVFAQAIPDTPSRRLLRASEAGQIAAVNSALDQGMPPAQGDFIGLLITNKSSLALPLLEAKIEQVLRSANPQECFTVKGVDPHRCRTGGGNNCLCQQ